MSDAPLMLGVSGLRGIVGQSLTPEVALRYASAFGSWLREHAGGEPLVVVGRDGRAGGEMIERLAIAGLQAVGVRVCSLGVATTPTVGVATDLMEADGAMIVTASHNPQEWNGLKVLVRRAKAEGVDACAPSAHDAAAIVAAYQAGGSGFVPGDCIPSVWHEHEAPGTHVARVLNACEDLFGDDLWSIVGASGLVRRVVVDAVNASAPEADSIFFAHAPTHCVMLYGETSGVFPHAPEPTAENLSQPGGLCDAVRGLGASVGFAQDPDADRLAIIDEQGCYICEEYTLALAAEAVLGALGSAARGQSVCTNLSTSRMIDDVAARHGARVVRTAVGEANVVEAMRASGAVLGGEGNGGVIWPQVTFVRDSLSAMALVMGLVARSGKTISQLVADMPRYAIVKRKADLKQRSDADPALAAIARAYAGQKVDLQDGVRVDFADSWVHVRASNTEPILRLIAEAPHEKAATELLDAVEKIVKDARA